MCTPFQANGTTYISIEHKIIYLLLFKSAVVTENCELFLQH